MEPHRFFAASDQAHRRNELENGQDDESNDDNGAVVNSSGVDTSEVMHDRRSFFVVEDLLSLGQYIYVLLN